MLVYGHEAKMRRSSNYPNRKHTPTTMREEFAHAQRAGSAGEMSDLLLLIANAERPGGAPMLAGALQARNRQGQRRYNRERTFDQSTRNGARRDPVPGDHVRVPNDEVWLVTSLQADMIRSDDQPGCPGFRSCPIKLCTIVDAQAPDA